GEVALVGADRGLDLRRLAGVVERLERDARELELRARLAGGAARRGGDALVGGLGLRVRGRELLEAGAGLRLQRLADRVGRERRAQRRAGIQARLREEGRAEGRLSVLRIGLGRLGVAPVRGRERAEDLEVP